MRSTTSEKQSGTSSARSSAVNAALAEALAHAGRRRCAVCRNPAVAEVVRRWLDALAGKGVGFQLERLGPALEVDLGVYHSRTTLGRHIRRCEPELAARTSYR